MCECIEKITKEIHDHIHANFAKPNKPVSHYHIRATMNGRAIVPISIDLAKQMKPVESFIAATFCPFCGMKYEAA